MKKLSKDFRYAIAAKYQDLTFRQKIYILLGFLMLFLLIMAYPTYMWFTSNKEMAVIGKVNAPYTLNLSSGNEESLIYLDMSAIDVGDGTGTGPTHKDFVFGVQGSWDISTYCLQLAHTTNIPFKYTIYRVSKDDIYNQAQYQDLTPDLKDTSVEYIAHTADGSVPKGDLIYYTYRLGSTYDPNNMNQQFGKVMDEANYVNRQSGSSTNIAIKSDSNTYYSQTYDGVSVDRVQRNAMPLYMQSGIIRKDSESTGGQDFCDYYVLRVDWSHDNSIRNDKETDMVYITVVSSSVAGVTP